MTPDEINKTRGRILYRCRVCKDSEGLHWFAGTSCPSCSKPECVAALEKEMWDAAEEDRRADEWARANGYP